jgi:hypothetical protein
MALPRLTYADVVATTCLVALIGAGAVAAVAQTGSKTQLAACYKTAGKTKGAMRYLTKATAKCRKGEKKVSWNQAGTQGAPGARGAAGDALPSGAVAYFETAACPAGWTAYEGARGRYIVGLNAGGTLGAPVGTALANQESRAVGQHGHDITDPGHAHEIRGSGAALRVPSTIVSLAGRGTVQSVPPSLNTATTGIVAGPTGVTVNPAGTVAGTPAPYVQLLACRKA